MANDKLEGCPFCGGEAAIYESISLKQYRVFCKGCRTQTSLHDSKECIIAAWNTRAGWQDVVPTGEGWYWIRYRTGKTEPVSVFEWQGSLVVGQTQCEEVEPLDALIAQGCKFAALNPPPPTPQEVE